jgi:hypothetical protein
MVNNYNKGRCLYIFLVKHGIYRNYLYNVINDTDINGVNKLKILTNKKVILGYMDRNGILAAFSWHYTPEGENFWSDMNSKWHKSYRSIYDKKIR